MANIDPEVNLLAGIYRQAAKDTLHGNQEARQFLEATMEADQVKRLLSNAGMNSWIRKMAGRGGPPAPVADGEPVTTPIPTANAGEGMNRIPDVETTGQKVNRAIRAMSGRSTT